MEMRCRGTVIGLAMLCVLASCAHQPLRVISAEEEVIVIDSTLDAIQDSSYLYFLSPITERLNQELDVVIGTAPRAMRAYLPESELLNWSCDALYAMARQCYTGTVDFAVVNVGGIRCDWPEGNITRRNVFELMPFDNKLVIISLKGDKVQALCDCFARNKGQGVSGALRMQIVDGEARNIRIQGKPIVADAVYYIATSDYLSTGADHLTPLSQYIERVNTERKIRDLYMEYIIQTGVVASTIDGRMQLIQ